MIDIHAHYIPQVDDGSECLESSISMLKEAISNGVTDVICTPHFRKPFTAPYSEIKRHYDLLNKTIKEQDLKINIYLGREIYCTKDLYNSLNQDNLSMCNSKYILLEFSNENSDDIPQIVYDVKLKGFLPIVAHIERYYNLTIEDIIDVKNAGALIQINASSIFGKDKKYFKKKIKDLFYENLVDFVASDIHEDRVNYMGKAYKYVSKKYGYKVANNVFNENAKKIIQS